MDIRALQSYLSGQKQQEGNAVSYLRAIGERSARRAGLQPADVDALGVDFAAYILSETAGKMQQVTWLSPTYIQQAARWFTAKQLRRLRTHQRHQADAPLATEVLPFCGPDVSSLVVGQELARSIRSAVSRLPHADQRLFQDCLVDGKDSRHVAEELGCSSAAVRKRLERLRARLRQDLESAGYGALPRRITHSTQSARMRVNGSSLKACSVHPTREPPPRRAIEGEALVFW